MATILDTASFTEKIPFTLQHSFSNLNIIASPINQAIIEKSFTRSQLKTRWEYFRQFQSIKEIYDHLTLLASQGKLLCDYMNNSYCLIIDLIEKIIEIPLNSKPFEQFQSESESIFSKFNMIRSSIQSSPEVDTGDDSNDNNNNNRMIRLKLGMQSDHKPRKHSSILYNSTNNKCIIRRKNKAISSRNLIQSINNPTNIFFDDHDIEMIRLKKNTHSSSMACSYKDIEDIDITKKNYSNYSPSSSNSNSPNSIIHSSFGNNKKNSFTACIKKMKPIDEESKLGFLKENEIEDLKLWCNINNKINSNDNPNEDDEDIKEYEFELLYHPNIGEDNEMKAIDKFYSEAPLIILIKTSLGKKFGGYTSIGWDKPTNDTNDYAFKSDPNAFLFSIDKRRKYPIKEDKNNAALRCEKDYIAWFYRGLALVENFMTKRDNTVSLSNYGNGEPLYEINDGIRDFKVSELYVYKVVEVEEIISPLCKNRLRKKNVL